MRRVPKEQTARARTLRNESTPAERLLWTKLRALSPRFTRQLPAGPFILDFACRNARLAIELDGSLHATSETDAPRTAWLEAQGWLILRFWNNDVLQNPEGVVHQILATIEARTGTHPQPLPSREGRPRTPKTRP
jgi:very-short-patch-repair endonuclease